MTSWFEYLTSPFSSFFHYIGLWKKSGKLVFIGLDNAGKTTLLYRLKNDRMCQFSPTGNVGCEELSIGGIHFTAFDLGGHEQARRVWKRYFAAVDGIAFLIDACDKERFIEARQELDNVLNDEQIADVPVLILGNKVDKFGAVSEDELRYYMGLQGVCTGKSLNAWKNIDRRPVELFMVSVLRRQGYGDAFNWLSQYLSVAVMQKSTS